MPIIEPAQGHRYNGALYENELDAVECAIRDIGAKIVKEHAACAGIGLITHREVIVELLTAYERITSPAPVTVEPGKVRIYSTGPGTTAPGPIPDTAPIVPAVTDRDPATGLLPGQTMGAL